jgi:chromosomal replication initiator protein
MPVDPRLRFDNFVVGSGNRLAVAAAQAVAKTPGIVYNPLFMYSGSGLGKTHLMSAIANQVTHRQPDLTIDFVTLDMFVEALHAAIGRGDTEAFKQRYLAVGVLLIDDMQFLTGQRETQNELLRIFNALQADGRQIVMSSDRPPSEIADVDERLLTRMSGGLIVDIGAPDYETRIAIARAKCEERGVRFRSGVIEELGRIEFKNVRELQGALNRLIAFQTLGGEQMDASEVASVLGDLAENRQSAAAPTRRTGEFQTFLTDVASAVAQHVDQTKTRLGAAITQWNEEGYRTGPLERLLHDGTAPSQIDARLREFEALVTQLRELRGRAAEVDPSLAAHEAFEDPDRVHEAQELVERATRASEPPPGPSPTYTRSGLVGGASNHLAVHAADAVIAAPGARYNPLFVHGRSGVGKTHLLNAIGNGLLEAGLHGARVAYVPAQTFVDELIVALQENTTDRWRARYRATSALLIDDVQFLAGKERTQEELFHVFNALHTEGKQLVFASDCPPRDLTGLEERLRSRFEGGLVVEMQAPDPELRARLFARFLAAAGAKPDKELIVYLAGRPADSVREVLGMVNGLVAVAAAGSVVLTASFARATLEGAAPAAARVAGRSALASPFADEEKVVWAWPDPAARLIEEFR